MPHILLLEPDKLLAETYERALTHAGYEVFRAASGQEAINIADRNTPDLIILELQLPAHNGLEFLYELRSYSEWRTIPVIVNTIIPPSDAGLAGGMISKELGVEAWHYKPQTNLQTLIRSANEQLENGQE